VAIITHGDACIALYMLWRLPVLAVTIQLGASSDAQRIFAVSEAVRDERISTITLFVLSAVYVVVARDHSKKREEALELPSIAEGDELEPVEA